MPEPDTSHEDDLRDFGPLAADERLIGYNLPDKIEGTSIRHVFKVVSGERGKKIDARQAKVIMEVLEWIRDHPELQEHNPDSRLSRLPVNPIPPA